MTKEHRLDLNQWLDNTKETYEGYGYDYEFLGITDIQLNIERTKISLGLYVELAPNLRTRTKAILKIKSNKFNCSRKKYNINIWFYRPTQDSNIAKVECVEKCSNFVKGRHNVRILAWKEHCALIKKVEVLLERPNTKHAKFCFCDNCTYWFSSQYK